MRAVDTNVLVRLITRDDTRQFRAAEQLVSNGAWVSPLVLTETMLLLSPGERCDRWSALVRCRPSLQMFDDEAAGVFDQLVHGCGPFHGIE